MDIWEENSKILSEISEYIKKGDSSEGFYNKLSSLTKELYIKIKDKFINALIQNNIEELDTQANNAMRVVCPKEINGIDVVKETRLNALKGFVNAAEMTQFGQDFLKNDPLGYSLKSEVECLSENIGR